ncbi:unnamed protein product [Coffea canephora]|uniref:Uncharacterized protein n=1 Tax=Coffea canephora TaxID=49390 RepID=A0A068UH00_COFCA|nr:unnamed protein product [Coffea canephora]
MVARSLLFVFLLAHYLGHSYAATPSHYSRPPFNRSSFPDDFLFGAATAAYQIEGGAHEGGKGPSVWDNFTHTHPEKIWDHSNGDVAIDFYHRYKEDIRLVKNMGMDAFRFSLAWTRIVPTGKISEAVNQEGIKFYNNVINEVIALGLKPFVTLFHWDTPQGLEDEYKGWLHPHIVEDYKDYVDICFKEFGDRVKHWITLNEPISFSMYAYTTGTYAPGRCSVYAGNCTNGNSGKEPYIVAHHLLLAHATAAKLYKENYQKSQKGQIGVTYATHWFLPKIKTPEGLKAPYRALDFMLGWFLHPITYGNYPPSMRTIIGNRLPTFTAAQSKMLIESIDFLGMNYYTSNYASPALTFNRVNLSYMTDNHLIFSTDIDGVPIGQPTGLNWLFICPKGIRSLVLYIKEKYKNPPIFITENGLAESRNDSIPREVALKDVIRIKYHESHLWYLQKAIKEGANVKGYFAWSFIDDYEWDAGLTLRFGLNYVDYKEGMKRFPKLSALWFKKFLRKPSK